MDSRLNLSRCDKSDDNNRSIVIDIQYVAMLSGIYIQVCSSIAESREIFFPLLFPRFLPIDHILCTMDKSTRVRGEGPTF